MFCCIRRHLDLGSFGQKSYWKHINEDDEHPDISRSGCFAHDSRIVRNFQIWNRNDDLVVFGTPKICNNLVLNDLAPPDFLESWRFAVCYTQKYFQIDVSGIKRLCFLWYSQSLINLIIVTKFFTSCKTYFYICLFLEFRNGKVKLFDGYLTDIQPYYRYNVLQYNTQLPTCCDCYSGYSVCSTARSYADVALNPNSKPVIPKLVNPNSGQGTGRRRRKRSTDQQDDDDIDYDYNPDAYIYTRVNSSNDQNWNFTWPTSTGINETQAHNFCYTTLWLNATYRSLCPLLTADVIETVVQKCVRDVQV